MKDKNNWKIVIAEVESSELNPSERSDVIIEPALPHDDVIKKVFGDKENPQDSEYVYEAFDALVPLSNYVWYLPKNAIEEDEQAQQFADTLFEKIPNVSLLRMDDDKYALGLNAVGMDLSGHLFYAHYLLDQPIPKTLFERILMKYEHDDKTPGLLPFYEPENEQDAQIIEQGFRAYLDMLNSQDQQQDNIKFLSLEEVSRLYPFEAIESTIRKVIDDASENLQDVLKEELGYYEQKVKEIYEELDDDKRALVDEDIVFYFGHETEDVGEFLEKIGEMSTLIDEDAEHAALLTDIHEHVERAYDDLYTLSSIGIDDDVVSDYGVIMEVMDNIDERDEAYEDKNHAQNISEEIFDKMQYVSTVIEQNANRNNQGFHPSI